VDANGAYALLPAMHWSLIRRRPWLRPTELDEGVMIAHVLAADPTSDSSPPFEYRDAWVRRVNVRRCPTPSPATRAKRDAVFPPVGGVVIDGALSAQECELLVAEAQAAPSFQASLAAREDGTTVPRVDDYRRSRVVTLTSATTARARTLLRPVFQTARETFAIDVSRVTDPACLSYGVGNYFRPHADNSGDPRFPAEVFDRRIAVVVFLNDSGHGEDEFEGGDLVLYPTGLVL